MNMMPFPLLSQGTLQRVNLIGGWLARNDFSAVPGNDDAQLIVLAGNAVLPTINAAAQLAKASGLPLLITGGLGHSTTFLYAAVAQHPRYNHLRTTGLTEAGILARIAREFHEVPEEQLIVEEKSTNCGENASFTRALLEARGELPARAVLIQDPTMQRRTHATFTRAWRGAASSPQWLSYPAVQPVLENGARAVQFREPSEGLWPVERYLSLVLGEIPRLRNDANGYGPAGRDFIDDVVIPPEVLEAWQALHDEPQLTSFLRHRSLA